MPRYHRYGPRLVRHGRAPFGGAIWMIGLAVLFVSGHWWPGILVLVGISIVFSTLWKESQPQDDSTPAPLPDYYPTQSAAPVVIPSPSPAPVSLAPRADLLPGNCPRCGAPVRTNEIKWNGTHSANCSYCGSTLPMNKS